jgi:Ca2+/Na+ antiporter
MADHQTILKRRAIVFAILVFFFFCSIFILAPLGSFFVWISVGATLYCAFYSIYNLVLKSNHSVAKPKTAKKSSPDERSIQEHVRYHLPYLISMFLAALLLVLVYWMFFT